MWNPVTIAALGAAVVAILGAVAAVFNAARGPAALAAHVADPTAHIKPGDEIHVHSAGTWPGPATAPDVTGLTNGVDPTGLTGGADPGKPPGVKDN